mgnify:CR=1 FL=1
MKENYDFTQAERGQFHRQDVKLNLPVYLDEKVSIFGISFRSNLQKMFDFLFLICIILPLAG